jgi:hypothetical protein
MIHSLSIRISWYPYHFLTCCLAIRQQRDDIVQKLVPLLDLAWLGDHFQLVAVLGLRGIDAIRGAGTTRGIDAMRGADTTRGVDTMRGTDTTRGVNATRGADTTRGVDIDMMRGINVTRSADTTGGHGCDKSVKVTRVQAQQGHGRQSIGNW